MQTKNQATAVVSHRHFVAGPLFFAVFLALSSLSIRENLQANSLVVPTEEQRQDSLSAEAGETFTLPGGFAGISRQATSIFDTSGNHPILEEGASLFVTEGLRTMEVDSLMLDAWGGAFVVSRLDGVISIVSISAPVLVTRASDMFLIPVGMQWQGGEEDPTVLFPVSPGYLAQEQSESSKVQLPEVLPPAVEIEPQSVSWLSSFLLTEAERRYEAHYVQSLFGHLRSLVEADDAYALQGFLAKPDIVSALQSSSLLSEACTTLIMRGSDRVTRELLPLCLSEQRAWLLASVHPKLRSDAWAMPSPVDLGGAEASVRLLAFPLSDTLAEAVPNPIVERWKTGVEDFLKASDDPSAFLSRLSSEGNVLLDLLCGLYPERTDRYIANLEEILSPYRELLDTESGEFLDAITAPHSEDIVVESDDTTDAATKELLDAGALFGSSTVVSSVGDHSIRVEDVGFGGSIFSMNYDLLTKEVSGITQGGERLPFPMPFARFVEWAQER